MGDWHSRIQLSHRVRLTRCSAGGDGGGVRLRSANFIAERDVVLRKCDALGDGGGLHMALGSFAALTEEVTDCSARAGGAVYASESTVSGTRCSLTACRRATAGPGGAISAFNSEATLSSCWLAFNVCRHGGGVHLHSGRMTISKSTFSRNAGSSGDSTMAAGDAETRLRDSSVLESEAKEEGGCMEMSMRRRWRWRSS